MNALVAAGTEVRVLVRSLSNSSMLHGVQVVQGSFEDDASLTRAFDGIDTMFLAGRDSPDTVSQQRRVLTHARHVNVQHIVKLSAIGASPNSPIALMRDHHAIDEEIQAGPTNWTLLKPHLYMQNLLRLGDAFRLPLAGRCHLKSRFDQLRLGVTSHRLAPPYIEPEPEGIAGVLARRVE